MLLMLFLIDGAAVERRWLGQHPSFVVMLIVGKRRMAYTLQHQQAQLAEKQLVDLPRKRMVGLANSGSHAHHFAHHARGSHHPCRAKCHMCDANVAPCHEKVVDIA